MTGKTPKVLGKEYLVVFCKACGAGFRARQEPVFEGKAIEVRAPETLQCPGCGQSAVYQPREMRVAKYQEQGLGRRKRKQ